MKKTALWTAALAVLLLTHPLHAQVPNLINYQGRVAVGTTNFNSPPNGQFKFALVNPTGTVTYWSNDGTSTAGSQPTGNVSLIVTKGLYSVLLGDTTAPLSMTTISASAFIPADVRLRVWFSDGTGFQLLTPDQRLTPSAYLSDKSVTTAALADGAVGSAQLASKAVGSAQIGDLSVGAAQMAAQSVVGPKLADNAVTAAKISAGQVVKSLTKGAVTLTDAITLVEGPNITIAPSGNSLTISASGTISGTANVTHDASLIGNGGATALGVAVPLTLALSSATSTMTLTNSGSGKALSGTSTSGIGVYGTTSSSAGTSAGLWGESSVINATGVVGKVTGPGNTGTGVFGSSVSGSGVFGSSTGGYGVGGSSSSGTGVFGTSTTGFAGYFSGNVGVSGSLTAGEIVGNSTTSDGSGSAIHGFGCRIGTVGTASRGVVGESDNNTGVAGSSTGGNGVHGLSASATDSGIWGQNTGGGNGATGSSSGKGVYGVTTGAGQTKAGVWGQNDATATGGTAIVAKANGPGSTGIFGQGTKWAGYFEGPVGIGSQNAGARFDANAGGTGFDGIFVHRFNGGALGTVGPDNKALTWDYNGNVSIFNNLSAATVTIRGADVAEPFDIAEPDLMKGTVVVIDGDRVGGLKRSTTPYDKRVAGIVSGANGIHSGVILSQPGVNEGGQNVAISGRVYVLGDTTNGEITPGDLLTTSDTPGRAMKATDHDRAQGAIIGKAMSALSEGQGMVLVLVTLQ